MPDLSVLIPARNELWVGRTVADVLQHAEMDTEVIVVLDGEWPSEPLPHHPKLTVVHHAEAIGQRAATNLAAKISNARYVMKLDAHCKMAQGFDRVLIASAQELGDDVTQIPAQYNLHVFNWVCTACGWTLYQGPTPTACGTCGKTDTVRRDVLWQERRNKLTTAWRFDSDLKFQYWGDWADRPEQRRAEIHDVLSCLGACWFLSRERYFALGGMDEGHGSWGQMGTELACKSWLSGGRMVVNKRTWFAHMFRTQGGDFSFPYPLSGQEVARARAHSRHLWMDHSWPYAVRPLGWLLARFWPVPGWSDAAYQALQQSVRPAGQMGVVHYTDGCLPEALFQPVAHQLIRATAPGEIPIVSVHLGPDPGIAHRRWTSRPHVGARGPLTMFQQILAGLEELAHRGTTHAWLCEHDVLYPPEHFLWTPPRDDIFYYNEHVWKVETTTGRALHYRANQTSGLCAAVPLLIAHYRERIRRVEAEGRYLRTMGFEPGTRRVRRGGIDDTPSATWRSTRPLVDLRHAGNLTPSRWRKDQFRDQRYTAGWTEADRVPGWGITKGRFAAWLAEATG